MLLFSCSLPPGWRCTMNIEEQVRLPATLRSSRDELSLGPWTDERIFPFYVSVGSLIILAVHGLWISHVFKILRGLTEEPSTPKADCGFLSNRGGLTIFLFKFIRLLGTLSLLSLYVVTAHRQGWPWVDMSLVVALAYASIVALANAISPSDQGLLFSCHLSITTFAIFAVYLYRDAWPLMTFTLHPKDSAEGIVVWFKVALATLVGGVLPLLEPYPYIPYDPAHPMDAPNPEQTASIGSFLTYSFLERTIWHAYRIPHLSHQELPPLCDYDEVRNLVKRGYPRLSGKTKSSLLWGILSIFRRSLVYQAVALIVLAIATMAVPIGTNRLLAYLEHGGKDAVVRPWVWILWLACGPLIGATCFQVYVFHSTASMARTQSIFTSLIFEHSLRVRLKSDVGEKDSPRTDVTFGADSPPSPDTPGDSYERDGEDTDTVHSRLATDIATVTADATVVASETSPSPSSIVPKNKDKADKDADSEKISEAKKASNFSGKLNNLVTSDLENIVGGRDFFFVLLSAPLMSTAAMWFLYGVLGWSSFVGLAVMVALFPVPAWVAARTNGIQKERMQSTDARVQSVTEVVGILRMVKLFGWEQRVGDLVAQKREDELKLVWKRKVLDLLSVCVNTVIPVLHMLVTYGVYTVVMKRELTASVIFSSVNAFQILRGQVDLITFFVSRSLTAFVSLGRVSEFLQKTELLDAFTPVAPNEVIVDMSWAHHSDIGFGKTDFSWSNDKNDGAVTPSWRNFRLCIDDEVKFEEGAFTIVIGPTGSGKTSVLMALLGEMHYMPRAPDSWMNLPRRGGIAYAAQESWVLNETIKENILFGAPYDESRYNKVIYQCGLSRDLSLFDAGDATEVGEKGLTLSGGQKARITLARAVYSSAKILLLDDVLAALDVHTSLWVVDKCFKGDLINGRTVILVTHNVAMASPLADLVISMRDGRIVSQGSVNDALKNDKNLVEDLKHERAAIELEVNEDAAIDEMTEPSKITDKASGSKLVVAEEIAIGRVGWGAFRLFIDGLGGKWPFLFWTQYLGSTTLSSIASVLEMWWLGHWAQQYLLHDSSDISAAFYLGMYSVLVAIGTLSKMCYNLVYTYGTLRASRSVHALLMKSLLGSTFRWLDVTPTSRAIARCTQDIQSVDDVVSNEMNLLVDTTIDLLIRLATILWATPVFIFPAVFVAVFGGFLGRVYIKAQLSIKREMSNAKAPVLGTFGSAISGLTSIRAYAAQRAFRDMLYYRIDRHMRTARPFYNANRWIGQRLDTLGQLFTASLAFYLVYGGGYPSPSTVGFILSMSTVFSEMIIWWVRIYNDFEVAGNSLERIQQYLDIDHEAEPQESGKPPAYWPSTGEFHVENLSARYSLDGPKVLQDISFHARAGQRIGIVGRTGSGKSTLTLAILRCIHTEGTVIFDGIPTHSINLDALRSNVTIIPQVPELLSGTLRHNLDMFGQYDDAVLNDALRSAGLFSLQSASDENRLTLDSEVASAGGNLSVGQRQIVALARAIVRQSKLLVLDEATSAIDYETDAVIQSSLRTELRSDVTVITVAHRLQTIMDYDKILVLDAGHLVEFDAPKELLKKEDSLLRALVDESADKDTLYAMAESKI